MMFLKLTQVFPKPGLQDLGLDIEQKTKDIIINTKYIVFYRSSDISLDMLENYFGDKSKYDNFATEIVLSTGQTIYVAEKTGYINL